MAEYFSKDYHGGDFVLFGATHLISLGLVAAVCLVIWLLRHRFTPNTRRAMRWGLFALIYLNEGSWHVWKLATGDWNANAMLPLWLCSLTAWTMPLLLIFRSRRYYEWVYPMGLIGASLALSTPDLMNYGFPHYRFIEFFALHGALIVAVIYMTVVEGFRPHWKALPWVLLVTNLYWLFCAWVNPLVGGNYLYTQGKLPTPSLLDVLGPYPWYLLAMEGLGILLYGLLYLPFALRDWTASRAVHVKA